MSNDDRGPDEERVGYGRPPKASQFKPGKSGNPLGAPRKPKTPGQLLKQLLNRKIRVNMNGQAVKISTWQAVMTKMVDDALRGDAKSRRYLFDFAVDTGYADTPEGLMELVKDNPSNSKGGRYVMSLMSLAKALELVGLAVRHPNGAMGFDDSILNVIRAAAKTPEELRKVESRIIDLGLTPSHR